MSNVHAAQNKPHYSATGTWGALAGLVASLMAWYRQDLSFSGTAIALYVAIPIALVTLAVAIPRYTYRSGRLFVAAVSGFIGFCYGMFLFLLWQHVV